MQIHADATYIIAPIFSLLGALAVAISFVKYRKYKIIKDTPRSKIRSLAMGIVEIHGSVDTYNNTLIKTPFSKTDCVYYKYVIKEYRQKKSGKTTSYHWENVASGDNGIAFMAKDETGEVYVDPTGAETDIKRHNVFYQERHGFFGNFRALGQLIQSLKKWDGKDTSALFDIDSANLQPISERGSIGRVQTGDKKFYEYYIAPGDNLFVLGTAANGPDVPNNVLIKKGKNEKTFIISDRQEKGVLRELKKVILVSLIFGSIFFITGIAILLKEMGKL